MIAPSAHGPPPGGPPDPLPWHASPGPPAKFVGFANAALILGIIGVVFAIVPLLDVLTMQGAIVGFVSGIIAMFGSRKVVAGIGTVLCVLAVIFTSLIMNSSTTSMNGTTTTTPSPSYTDQAPSDTYTPPPPPRPASPPTVYNGSGDDIVSITKDPGVAVLQFACPKCTDNTIVTTDGSEQTLVNEIGSYTGKHLIDLRDGSTTTTVTVKATEAWKMTVASGLGAATVAAGDAPVAGQGDDVVLMNGTATKARITNRGQSNFIVYVISIRSPSLDLAVNEVGGYEGTVALGAPAVITIKSSGTWTVTPS
jgi:hypothetical protein